MAPGSSAQKRKKELEARREAKAAKAAARLVEAAANETVIPEPAVSIPGLEDTNPSGSVAAGGGANSVAGGVDGGGVGAADVEGDDGPPISIRCRRGPDEPGNDFLD